jgi:hypothetical protein
VVLITQQTNGSIKIDIVCFLKFEYYGAGLTNKNSIREEIKSRLKLGNAFSCHSVQNSLSCSLLPKILKVEIYRTGISLFHRAFQFSIYYGPTNALVCNKTLIQMSHTKTLKITRTCFDHQMIETCWSDFKCFSV